MLFMFVVTFSTSIFHTAYPTGSRETWSLKEHWAQGGLHPAWGANPSQVTQYIQYDIDLMSCNYNRLLSGQYNYCFGFEF